MIFSDDLPERLPTEQPQRRGTIVPGWFFVDGRVRPQSWYTDSKNAPPAVMYVYGQEACTETEFLKFLQRQVDNYSCHGLSTQAPGGDSHDWSRWVMWKLMGGEP